MYSTTAPRKTIRRAAITKTTAKQEANYM